MLKDFIFCDEEIDYEQMASLHKVFASKSFEQESKLTEKDESILQKAIYINEEQLESFILSSTVKHLKNPLYRCDILEITSSKNNNII